MNRLNPILNNYLNGVFEWSIGMIIWIGILSKNKIPPENLSFGWSSPRGGLTGPAKSFWPYPSSRKVREKI